jgi:hypothetical protein
VKGKTAIIGLSLCCWAASAGANEGSGKFATLIGEVLPGPCDNEGCKWFTIENSRLDGISAKGELYRIASKWWVSKPKREKERIPPLKLVSEGENHVFCSTTTPAIIIRTEPNGWKATRIAPEQKSTIRKEEESEIALYWGPCRRAAEADVYLSGTRLGKRLKYQVSYPFPDGAEIALTSPLDVMKW